MSRSRLKEAVDNVAKDPMVPATVALALQELYRAIESIDWHLEAVPDLG